MFKRSSITILLLAAILFTSFYFFSYSNPAEAVFEDDTAHLVIEAQNNKVMPKHFRKTTDLALVKTNQKLNLNGLDELNISGSHQFSVNGIRFIKSSIGAKLPILDIDLRQESHGFLNGNAVSWANKLNNANAGMSLDQVLKAEEAMLNGIVLNKPIRFFNHPKISIRPKKVQSEKQVVESHKISYLRVPVTDGKLPSDDMVDYFVKAISSLREPTWLHFHCKEGIGRTTTFMAMYDMMKNAKTISAEEIIDRQVAMANLSPNSVQSFYSKERIEFLKAFHKYCIENTDNFKTNWSQSRQPLTSGFVKNTMQPKELFVISQDNISSAERTMLSTLQGLIANNSDSLIYLTSSSHPDYKLWLDDLKANYGVDYKTVTDPWQLLNRYKAYVKGYVLYSRSSDNDPSINNACTLAALEQSIAIDANLEAKVKSIGITKPVGDCRNTDESWAFNNLWNSDLNKNMVIELSPKIDSALRDYAIMTKSLVFYESDPKQVALRNKVFSSLEKDSICLGWGPDEYVNISTASQNGVCVIPADWSYNLSVLSAFPSTPASQYESPAPSQEEGVHYVTFIMSDGDNQQWYLGSSYTSPKWYGSTQRGSFNMGWTISPSMYYLTPSVFNLYYKSAKQGEHRDYFMVSPSGLGYMLPSKYDPDDLSLHVRKLNSYMKEVDQRYVSVIDDNGFRDIYAYDKYTNQPNIEGIFYLNFKRQDDYKGEILWSNEKPIVSCRYLLWANLEEEESLINKINSSIAEGETDVKQPTAYSVVYVHAWSKDMDRVSKVISKLKENPKVRIVAPDTLMTQVKNNLKK